jgi:acyl-CoA synthetase (NDP forming)
VSLERFRRPRHVAVIGASADVTKTAGRVLLNLGRGSYQPQVSAVNPKYDEIAGIACYARLADIPGAIDVAVVVVPAAQTPAIVDEIGACGIPYAILMGGGFAEAGVAGADLQRTIVARARAAGVRLYGPNTNGFFDITGGFGYTFSAKFDPAAFVSGSIGLVVQGGGMGRAVLDAMDFGIGFSMFASTGNEADLDIADFIDELVDDPATHVIATIIESLSDGERFIAAALRAFAAGKPIVALKVGRNELGNRQAQSQTGKLAGDFAVYAGVFAQCGVTLVDDIAGLLRTAYAFSIVPGTPNLRLGLLTYSGGSAVLAADLCGEEELSLPALSQQSQERLRAIFPAFAQLENPADVTTLAVDRPPLYRDAIRIFADDPNIDVVIVTVVIPTLGAATAELARAFVEAVRTIAKPVLALWLSLGKRDDSYDILADGRLVFTDSVGAFRALGAVQRYARLQARRTTLTAAALPRLHRNGHTSALASSDPAFRLSESEAKSVLAQHAIPTTRETLTRTLDEALAAAAALGYPVVMKIDAAAMPHKSEFDAVRLGIADATGARSAFAELTAIAGRHLAPASYGILVQEMLPAGLELVVGARRDPVLGPIVMAGLGGVFVEILRDVQFRRAPLADTDALEMLDALRAGRVLHGTRGRPAVDRPALVALLRAVGDLMLERPEIAELDLNPVFVFAAGRGCCVADALITLVPQRQPAAALS